MIIYARTVAFVLLLAVMPAFADGLNDRLWSAASSGDLEGVKSALEDGADVDYSTGFSDARMSTLQVAAMNGHADVVALLLKRGANINIVDNVGDTPLNTALLHNKKSVIEVLIANGANVRHAGIWGYTPLHQVAMNGDLETAKLLLDRGADPNAVDDVGDTPLDTASNAPVADFLLAHGAHVSAVSMNGTTRLPNIDRDLLMAVVAGNAQAVRSAINRGAHVNIRGGSRAETPLIRAVYLGRLDAATTLLSAGADIEEGNSYMQTPLIIAVGQGDLKLVQLLLAHRANIEALDYRGRTPLGLARDAEIAQMLLRAGASASAAANLVCGFGTGDVKLVELLLSYGMDANPKTGCAGNTPLLTALTFSKWDVAMTLLNHGADPNASGDGRSTPLTLAVGGHGNTEAVDRLLARGADPNALDKAGHTPLIEATRYGTAEVVKLLLDRGANARAKDRDGNTALAAIKDIDTLDLLISHGANVEDLIPLMFGKNAKLDARQTAFIKAVVTGSVQGISAAAPSREEINKQFPDGSSLLNLATMFGRTDVINWLLDHGADPNASTTDGITSLHVAIIAMTQKSSQKVAMMQLLLKHGATIDAPDREGRTPLHLAAATYNRDAVDCLLRNGADPLRRTKDGLTPIQVAQRSEHGTGLFGIATQVDETEKSATIDVLRTAVRARPVR